MRDESLDRTGRMFEQLKPVNEKKVYKVHYMTVCCTYENIVARNEKEAIAQCDVPPECDLNEFGQFIAIEEE